MNLGGGANINGTGEGLTGSANGTYGFTDKRQTNFATIGEGEIIIRDESSTGDPEKYNSLKRDVAISQYNTKDGGLQGGFTVDADTVNLVENTVNKIDSLIENPKDTIVNDYNNIVAEAKEIYRKVDERNDKLLEGAVELKKQTDVIIEKSGNLVGSGHFTTDDKVQYYVNMDDYEADKANGVKLSASDKIIYYDSKEKAGETLSIEERGDRVAAAYTLNQEAITGLQQDILGSYKTSGADEINGKIDILKQLDPNAAAGVNAYLKDVRDTDKKRQIIAENNSTIPDTITAGNSNGGGVRGVIEGWGQALSSWGTEKNKEATELNKTITDSNVVQSGHRAGEWMNENPDQVLSTITDFTPIIGQGKGVIDAVTGKDLVTGEDLAGWQRGLSLASVVPVGKVADKVGDVIKAADNVVYLSKNADDVVQYVGITNDFTRRAAEHLSEKGINIEPLIQGLSRSEARAVEQTLIELHGLEKNGGTLINKINSISQSNPIYDEAKKKGSELLQSIEY
jgi:hypothetical protein